jgi:hypothetical protein
MTRMSRPSPSVRNLPLVASLSPVLFYFPPSSAIILLFHNHHQRESCLTIGNADITLSGCDGWSGAELEYLVRDASACTYARTRTHT